MARDAARPSLAVVGVGAGEPAGVLVVGAVTEADAPEAVAAAIGRAVRVLVVAVGHALEVGPAVHGEMGTRVALTRAAASGGGANGRVGALLQAAPARAVADLDEILASLGLRVADTRRIRAALRVFCAELEVLHFVSAAVHHGDLQRVSMGEAHSVAHRPAGVPQVVHRLLAVDAKEVVAVVHHGHDVIRQLDVSVLPDVVVVPLVLLDMLHVHAHVVVSVRTGLLVHHAEVMAQLMNGDAHAVAARGVQVAERGALGAADCADVGPAALLVALDEDGRVLGAGMALIAADADFLPVHARDKIPVVLDRVPQSLLRGGRRAGVQAIGDRRDTVVWRVVGPERPRPAPQ
mmetsp:Transcript_150220/g.418529  ORF Transcript_150220/g.418529 Transcript_150220/m.418529 type:complete len:349 (-) Transcript_150220:690-1736(-)